MPSHAVISIQVNVDKPFSPARSIKVAEVSLIFAPSHAIIQPSQLQLIIIQPNLIFVLKAIQNKTDCGNTIIMITAVS